MHALTAIAMAAAAAASGGGARVAITQTLVDGGQTFELLEAARPVRTFCVGESIAIANESRRAVSVDLYAAHTDTAHALGVIAAGASATTHVDAPIDVVALDSATGRPLAYFAVRECPKAI